MKDTTWFVVYTENRREAFANDFLSKQLGLETLFLHYWGKTTHARRVRSVIRSLYPRYLFVGLKPHQSLHAVNNAYGVSTVVYCGDEPLVVPQAVIDEQRQKGLPNGEIPDMSPKEKRERRRFKTGQGVKVDHGPFQGFIGQVSIDRGYEIQVWLEDMNRRLRVTFPPEALSPELRRIA